MNSSELIQRFAQLQPGDRIELRHQVKVGFRVWTTTTTGIVVRTDRRRHSLHFRRNFDDKVFSDVVVLRLDSGELSTVTLDEFSELRILVPGKPLVPSAESTVPGGGARNAGATG